MHLGTIDILFVILYLLIIAGVSVWSIRKSKDSPSDFFFACSLFFNSFLGVDFWTGSIILVLVTGIYTILGGLHTVMYTEAIQAIILLLGSAILLFIGLDKVGGWQAMIHAVPKEKLNMF